MPDPQKHIETELDDVPTSQMDKPWNQPGRNPLLQQHGVSIEVDRQKKNGFWLDCKDTRAKE